MFGNKASNLSQIFVAQGFQFFIQCLNGSADLTDANLCSAKLFSEDWECGSIYLIWRIHKLLLPERIRDEFTEI